MLQILAPAIAACLVMAGIHCYFGIHVIVRQVIFVDLALAQIAAMGAAVAAAMGYEPHSGPAWACSLGFTLLGAALFTAARFRDDRVPQEAIVGIVYAVSTAVMLLVLSRLAVERDEIEHMLVGRLLFASWGDVAIVTPLYAVVGLAHYAGRHAFPAAAPECGPAAPGAGRGGAGWRRPAWDFVFYATLGLVVTSSVRLAGVLPVFSFLVVPAACAMIFFGSMRRRLVAGWLFGIAGSSLGLLAAALGDFPPGEAVVAAFGVLFALCAAVGAVMRR